MTLEELKAEFRKNPSAPPIEMCKHFVTLGLFNIPDRELHIQTWYALGVDERLALRRLLQLNNTVRVDIRNNRGYFCSFRYANELIDHFLVSDCQKMIEHYEERNLEMRVSSNRRRVRRRQWNA